MLPKYKVQVSTGTSAKKGPSTFLWTVSSADNYCPELHSLMPHPDRARTELTHGMRMQAVISNPHLTDWYFTSRLSDWVQHWLYDALGASWHWYRYEYQARGSTHAHGCAKLSNDPGICTLVAKAAAAWEVSEGSTNTENIQIPENADTATIIRDGNEAKSAILKYCDWLVTTCNEALPDELWRTPQPHPCTVSFKDITDLDDDYHDLTNSVQRHTRCNAAYCLRQKNNSTQPPTCRFNYPRSLQTESTFTFERLSDGTIRCTLLTRRNDPRVNSHNRLLLQHWRANVDVQIIVDIHACARYMAKYAAKSEPRSRSVAAIFESCVGGLQNDSDSKSALRRAMIRAVGERDFSSQETAHMLLSLPLTSCSFSFITLSLSGSRKLLRNKDSGELELKNSLLDHYASRSIKLQMSLLQFASEYSMGHKKTYISSYCTYHPKLLFESN